MTFVYGPDLYICKNYDHPTMVPLSGANIGLMRSATSGGSTVAEVHEVSALGGLTLVATAATSIGNHNTDKGLLPPLVPSGDNRWLVYCRDIQSRFLAGYEWDGSATITEYVRTPTGNTVPFAQSVNGNYGFPFTAADGSTVMHVQSVRAFGSPYNYTTFVTVFTHAAGAAPVIVGEYAGPEINEIVLGVGAKAAGGYRMLTHVTGTTFAVSSFSSTGSFETRTEFTLSSDAMNQTFDVTGEKVMYALYNGTGDSYAWQFGTLTDDGITATEVGTTIGGTGGFLGMATPNGAFAINAAGDVEQFTPNADTVALSTLGVGVDYPAPTQWQMVGGISVGGRIWYSTAFEEYDVQDGSVMVMVGVAPVLAALVAGPRSSRFVFGR